VADDGPSWRTEAGRDGGVGKTGSRSAPSNKGMKLGHRFAAFPRCWTDLRSGGQGMITAVVWIVVDLVAAIVGEFVFEVTDTVNKDRELKPAAVVWFVLLGLAAGDASPDLHSSHQCVPSSNLGESQLGAVQQQDAADEVRAFTMAPSQRILVLGGPLKE
jgi:hypothetical protein